MVVNCCHLPVIDGKVSVTPPTVTDTVSLDLSMGVLFPELPPVVSTRDARYQKPFSKIAAVSMISLGPTVDSIQSVGSENEWKSLVREYQTNGPSD
jgi:hypothetical protein